MSEKFKPSFHEINYASGLNIKTFDIDKYLCFEAYFSKEGPNFERIKLIPNILDPKLTWLEIIKKIRYIHILFKDISEKYNTEISGMIQYPFKEHTESIIFHMKTVIDMQVQLASLETDYDSIINNHKFNIDSFGKVLGLDASSSALKKIICGGDCFEKDNTNFLTILNNLFNSIKHCSLHSEAYSQYGIDSPTVVTLYVKDNNFGNEIEYHNHYLFQLIIGFDNNVRRIFRNMRLYQEVNGNDE